jgi:hypothetical protein
LSVVIIIPCEPVFSGMVTVYTKDPTPSGVLIFLFCFGSFLFALFINTLLIRLLRFRCFII